MEYVNINNKFIKNIIFSFIKEKPIEINYGSKCKTCNTKLEIKWNMNTLDYWYYYKCDKCKKNSRWYKDRSNDCYW